jgi:cell division septal protein FtsQ
MNGVGTTEIAPGALGGRPPAPPALVDPPRRGLFRRRQNRRVTVSSPSVALWIARVLQSGLRRGLVVLKALAAVAVLAGATWGGERAVRHVIASPRFAVREIRVSPTQRVAYDQVVALAAVEIGDKLISIDTDAVAVRVASHPWVASARVRRELPSVLAIDVVERRAAAAALLGGIYLIDESGHPFKRATLDEADGLVLITGVTRQQYAAFRDASAAAFREALAIADEYRAPRDLPPVPPRGAPPAVSPGDAAGPARPALSEVHIDPRYGFSLLLYDGGGEIRLGRGDYTDKLARLDRILAGLRALGARGPAALRTVHLDGPNRDRVPVRLADSPAH